MTTRTATLEADLVGSTTVVALPPSDLDPSSVLDGTSYDDLTVYDATTVYTVTYLFDQMRVYVNGARILRGYDPGVTGAGAGGYGGGYEGGY